MVWDQAIQFPGIFRLMVHAMIEATKEIRRRGGVSVERTA